MVSSWSHRVSGEPDDSGVCAIGTKQREGRDSMWEMVTLAAVILVGVVAIDKIKRP